MDTSYALRQNELVMNWRAPKALLLQASLAGAAVLLPALCHLLGVPVYFLLPMHWPVLLAGLVYGWRGGLLVGLMAPLASFAFSGMPTATALAYVGAELAAYGFATGFMREVLHLKSYAAIAAAIIFGRIVYVAAFALFTGFKTPAWAMLSYGLAAAVLQAIILPSVAEKWTGKPQR
ncbi:MAG: ECF transporter S component [Elusimicrobia bacterium]|nr:ECF transporter S component [Elusimicrobiota bacterium]